MNDRPTEPELAGLDLRLVAYLDGELDTADARALENALATDDRMRDRLREMQRAWDLLDELPRAEVNEDFTRTTVEMAAVDAEEALAAEEAAAPVRRRRDWLLAAAAALLSAGVGFVVAGRNADRENDQLVHDLPVIEHLDAYRNTESVEFLRMLHEENLFPPEVRHDP